MDDEIFIENVESSNISSDHRTRSSSVIDSIGIKDLFTTHANIAVPCRSKSLSTLDHYVRRLLRCLRQIRVDSNFI